MVSENRSIELGLVFLISLQSTTPHYSSKVSNHCLYVLRVSDINTKSKLTVTSYFRKTSMGHRPWEAWADQHGWHCSPDTVLWPGPPQHLFHVHAAGAGEELVLSPPANPPHGAAAAAAATRYSLSDLPCGEMENAGQWCCLQATRTILNQIKLLIYDELRYFF